MSALEQLLGQLPDRLGSGKSNHIFTPKHIAKDMVAILPEEVFHKNATFLDICCKSGIFLYEIYNRLMNSESMIRDIPDKKERREYILNNQLFGIAPDPMCQMMATRTTYGYIEPNSHIRVIDNYIQKIKNKNSNVIKEEFGEDMEFNVIIGNPPYQDESNKAIYQHFVSKAMELNPDSICMITKDNWFNQYQFRELRKQMVTDYNLSEVTDYPNVGEVFPNAQVSAAIMLLENKDKTDATTTKFISIQNGIKKEEFNQSFANNKVIIPREMDCTIINKLEGECYSSRFTIANMWQKMHTKYSHSILKDEEHPITYVLNKEPYEVYFSRNYVADDRIAAQYKIMCSLVINHAFPNHPGNVLTNIKLGYPDTIFYDTWVTVGHTDDREEAINIEKYMMTQFLRYLVNATIVERGNVTEDTFAFVPLQDFTSNSDIDWSLSVAEIDKQLYKKYNLTEEEIQYIESTIKPMG